MPPYLNDQVLAAQLQLGTETIGAIAATNADDLEWLLAFLSADRLSCYCLYQSAAPRRTSGTAPGTHLPANPLHSESDPDFLRCPYPADLTPA